MNNFEKMQNLFEGVKVICDDKYTKEDAAKKLKCDVSKLIFSNRDRKNPLWINDDTSEAVCAAPKK